VLQSRADIIAGLPLQVLGDFFGRTADYKISHSNKIYYFFLTRLNQFESVMYTAIFVFIVQNNVDPCFIGLYVCRYVF
jgi:hypothetical protein